MRMPAPLTDQELRDHSILSTRLFVENRFAEQTKPYAEQMRKLLPQVRQLFEASNDLMDLGPDVLLQPGKRPGTYVISQETLAVMRYLSAPGVSEDNLDDFQTLDLDTLEPLPLPVTTPQRAKQTIRVLLETLDPFRFPWLAEGRGPSHEEREHAILWTASTLASERVRTLRRTEGSRSQEQLVADELVTRGWTLRAKQPLALPSDLPPSSFMRETHLAQIKCDLPVRLKDGRLVAIECKVSNTGVNSVKRLCRETGGKAARWRTQYGEAAVISCAVISGVFRLVDLKAAQEEYGIFVVFQHDLERLHLLLGSP